MLKNLFFLGISLFYLPFLGYGQTVDFSADVTSGCSPLVVQFTDESTGSPSSWFWDFGNGNTSTLQNPGAIYANPGVYTVSLTINGNISTSKTDFVTVYNAPVVNFNANVQSGCTPLTVEFSDSSSPGSGSITAWEWIFGDGGVSTEQNPQYTYMRDGNFSVTLTVTNQFDCESVLSKSNLISVQEFESSFQVDQTDFCEFPAEVSFTNLSTGPGTLRYTWDFGDGVTSSETSPKHVYTASGSYTVSLTVNTEACSSPAIENIVINVGNKPAPDFNVIPEIGCRGEPISFLSADNPDISTWNWNFGDGNSSTVQNTAHTYVFPGSYDVELSTIFSDGCSAISTKEVTVLNLPSPNFNTRQDCDKGIFFTNVSDFADAYLWDFGDGNFSEQENPFHEYSALGSYRVRLRAVNSACNRTYERVINVGVPLVANFEPIITSTCGTDETLGGCLPKTINFKDVSFSQNGIVDWLWDFGDGSTSSEASPSYTYTTAGDFEVRLRVTDQSGCTSTKEREVHVIPPNDRPVASFEINKTEICVSEVVRLTSNSTGNVDFWCWNLGDGSTLQTTQPILNFAYRDVGVYTISLSVSYKGCPSEETYVLTDVVTVLEPKPEFSVVKNCADPYTIELSNSTQNADSFFWSFGDGETTSEQDPGTHTYAQTGNYTLSLEATNNTTGCTVRSLSSITIYDVESDFSVSNNRVCINEAVDFTDLSTDAVRWLWDFEDGRTSFTASPKNISFTDPGKYTISLTAYDQDDCSDKLEKMDFVVVADIQGRFRENRLNNFCDSLKVEFQDLSFASPAIDEWTWDFGDGTTSSDQNPVHTYSDFGEYTVSLTVQNIEGRCTVLQNDLVVFTEPRPDFQFTKNAFCVGEEVAAFNSSRNAQTYFWYVNNDTIESPNLVTSFPEKGRYQITLASFDRDNCSNQIAKEVSIQKPVADFEAQQISAECPPLISTFLSKSSDQVVNWDWRINDDFFSSVENPSHTFDIPGDYDVSLVVADDLGCTDSIRVNELIQLGGPFGEYAVSDSAACLTQNVEFSVVASNSVTYIWDFGNGVVQTTDSPAISHRYAEVGAYNPSLILEDEFGCRVSPVQDIQINIFDTTGVAFTIPANYPFTGESIEVIFDDLPDGNWTWDMGDGTTISNDLPQYAYAEGGTYNVQLSFINENGCKSQFNQTVFIQEDLKFIPNVFTPNGDIANDTFDMLDLEKGFWNVKIFNRNGVLVFDKESYDGTWTARNVAAGTYYYVVVNQFRKEKTYKGYIQVLK